MHAKRVPVLSGQLVPAIARRAFQPGLPERRIRLPVLQQRADFFREPFVVVFRHDRQRADAVYAGVDAPLVAQDVAECIVWALERPAHVNIDLLTVRPVAQASNTLVARR